MSKVVVDGREVPEQIITHLKRENLAKEIYKNPKYTEFISKFKSIEIKDGKLTIVTK